MAKALIHEGTVSWWSGKGTALCGAVIPKAEYKGFFTSVTCKACKQAKKGR